MSAFQLIPALLLAFATAVMLGVVPIDPVRHVGPPEGGRAPVVNRFGGWLRQRVGVVGDDSVQDRLWGLSAMMLPLLVVHPAMLVIGLLGVWGQHIAGARRNRLLREQAGWVAAPEAAHVMALAVRSGANVYQAIDVVALRVPGRGGAAFAEVSRRLAMGVLLDQALDELTAQLGEAADPIHRVVRRCVVTGAELAPALERVAIELRAQQHQRQLEAARRLPVLLLFPLVTCTLPAFALLTVVPLLVSSLASLSG